MSKHQTIFDRKDPASMMTLNVTATLIVAVLALLPGGCAPQPATPMQAKMQAMGMSELMAHCEQMKEQMQPGVTITEDMRRCVDMFMEIRDQSHADWK